MSEIKIALDLFDKGDKLNKIVNGLKAVDGLVKSINKKKIDILSDDLDRKLKTLGDITKLVRQIDTERKKEVANQTKLNNKLKQEKGLLGSLKKEVKDLKLAQNAAKTEEELKNVNTQLQKAQMNVRKFGALGKQNTNTFSNALSSFGFKFNFLSDIVSGTAFAISSGLTNALKDSINVFKDFEQANANLAAVLGVNSDQITELTEDAKRLGATTAFTASQVSELQTEYAKLGFTQDEILKVTESTLDASAALGSELGEQAALTGAVLRSFGLDASEATRVNDVLAKSASSSALDFQKLSTALPIVSATANSAGVSLERTTALLGTLSDRGVDASTAATGLRNVFLDIAEKGLTFEEAMNKINTATDKNVAALDLFGKRGATIGTILASTADSTEALEEKLNSATGFAARTAATRLDTLEGSLTKLGSAWEGFILGIEDGNGAINTFLRSAADLATQILGLLTPSQELAGEWFKQRDALQSLESTVNPLIERYDELSTQTELSVDEQEELDTVIQSIANNLPEAITQFDEYGNAISISSEKVGELLQLQKDILALENAEAIEEQEDKIEGLNNQLAKLNREYFMLNGELVKYDSQLKQNIKADAQEIRDFQTRGAAIQREIFVREEKIRQLKGEKTETQLNAEEQAKLKDEVNNVTDSLIANTDSLKDNKDALNTLKREVNRVIKELDELDEALSFVPKEEEEKEIEDGIETVFEIYKKGQEKILLEGLKAGQKRNEIEVELAKNTISFLEQEIKARKAFGEDTTQLEIKLAEARLKVKNDELAKEKQIAEERKQIAETIASSSINSLEDTADIIQLQIDKEKELAEERGDEGALLALEQREKKLVALRKATAVAEIGINLASEISNIRKKYSDEQQGAALSAVEIGAATLAAAFSTAKVLAFYEGGYTGDGGKYEDAGIVHKGEFVNTKEQVSKYGMRNWSAKDFDDKVKSGWFNQFAEMNKIMPTYILDKPQVKVEDKSNTQLINEIKDLKEIIASKPVSSFSFDNFGNIIETAYRKGVKNVITHKRKDRL